MYKAGRFTVLEPPFPDSVGLPEVCRLALVYVGEGEKIDLLISSAAVFAENQQWHRVWFETWAGFLNDPTVPLVDKLNCLAQIERVMQEINLRREQAEALKAA